MANKLFFRFDDWCNKLYEDFTKRFTGKVIIKIVSEVFLALLVSGAVFIGTSIYDNNKMIKEENTKLEQLYVYVSNKYVEFLFGEPYITVYESESLKSNFYLLNDAVLRTVTEDDVVVAFFITIQNEHRYIPVTSHNSDKHYLGKTNYYEVNFSTPNNVANLNNNGRYCYYGEIQGTGRYAIYNNYLFATVSYGVVDDESAQLCNIYSFPESKSTADVELLRKKAKPNTFGIIAEGYENIVSVIPFVEEWENIYHMLVC